MAARYALDAGAQVTLLEKNEKLGKKIYITGKGRFLYPVSHERNGDVGMIRTYINYPANRGHHMGYALHSL